MTISWTPNLAVGVEVIDAQHQEIFRRVAQLLDGMKGSHGKDELRRLVRFLESYVSQHFGEEEKLMRLQAYPMAQSHVAQHRKFAEDFLALKRDFDEDGASTGLVVQISFFVSNWLGDHIALSDRKLGQFLLTRPHAPQPPERPRRSE